MGNLQYHLQVKDARLALFVQRLAASRRQLHSTRRMSIFSSAQIPLPSTHKNGIHSLITVVHTRKEVHQYS